MGQVKEYLAYKIEKMAAKLAPKLEISTDEAYDYLWDEWAQSGLDVESLETLVEHIIGDY